MTVNISAAMVKELRERTSSGMMECKKALVEANGDMELAIENMRKSGLAKADKKSDRIAAEGIIGVKVSADGTVAAMVDVNCETDFVAKADDFVAFANDVTELVLANDIANDEALLAATFASGQSVDEVRRGLISKLGENITVRRFERLVSANGGLASYLHGSKIGILVELTNNNPELGKDIAMHVAACKPVCVNADQVSATDIAKEKEIFLAKQEDKIQGKPANIVENMIAGFVKKYLAEITLLGQPFVKDDSMTVEQLLKSKGTNAVRFTRFAVGEGIEKKVEDFAAEVMAQVNAQ
jgi:elongation factor Ts